MLSLKKISDENRKDIAFQMVVAMRDAVDIAKKKSITPTYENTMQLYYDFSPELYEEIVECLPQRNLSDDAKVFVAQARAESIEKGIDVDPLTLLDRDIEHNKNLVKISTNEEDRKTLRNKISSLTSLRKSLLPRKLSENRILIRDTSKADRSDFGATFIGQSDFYVDYELPNKRYLRIRLLHPDKPEHITGADLVYEQHNVDKGLIRIVMLQYKIWENSVLYFSKAKNLEKQLTKLKTCLCDNNYCDAPSNQEDLGKFRFPHCAAFLRPTDKLQEQNEKLVSSGIHIPICDVERLRSIEGDRISKKNIRYQSLNHDMFEMLFNRGFVGSRWMPLDEVEDFYKKNNILEKDDSIILYAREVKEKEDEKYVETDI